MISFLPEQKTKITKAMHLFSLLYHPPSSSTPHPSSLPVRCRVYEGGREAGPPRARVPGGSPPGVCRASGAGRSGPAAPPLGPSSYRLWKEGERGGIKRVYDDGIGLNGYVVRGWALNGCMVS